jgi:hypothetical protein
MSHAARGVVLLLLGAALRDCVLLGSAALVWGLHQQQRLDACPDRAHAWLRCVLDGTTLLITGVLLAAHTASVFFGWWPTTPRYDAFVSATLAVVIAVGGLAPEQLTRRHAVLMSGVVAVALARLPWGGCAFALCAAVFAVADGLRHLGPQSRALAAPHDQR